LTPCPRENSAHYVVADAADLITSAINIGVFPALLGDVYMIAILVGHLRYR
jgi:hypothetical protein